MYADHDSENNVALEETGHGGRLVTEKRVPDFAIVGTDLRHVVENRQQLHYGVGQND